MAVGQRSQRAAAADAPRRSSSRSRASKAVSDVSVKTTKTTKTEKEVKANAKTDRAGIILLIVLYLLQGIPLGLTFGSVPFLLKAHASYSDLALFSLSQFPYSLKLLWSPIVDTIFAPSVGRRKSWIIPIQFITGLIMLLCGPALNDLLLQDPINVSLLAIVFTAAVFLCATQDIAVDGWALSLLHDDNKAFASAAQTIGLNTGYFLSFTIFLALNSAEFCNKYIRSVPSDLGILQMGTYLQFWGLMFLLCNVYLMFFVHEKNEKVDESETVSSVYKNMWSVCTMPHMMAFIGVLLLSKIGFQVHEAVTPLKLIEKGFKKEDLALTVLIDFPFQFLFGYYAAKWSNGKSPLKPWLFAFIGRLIFSGFGMLIIRWIPDGEISNSWFVTVVLANLISSFMATVQFVSIGSFFTRISDPVIGGTYMTLLNTLSNLGGTWPKYFVLEAVEKLTIKSCSIDDLPCGEKCEDADGSCVIDRDGYYTAGIGCLAIGTIIFVFFVLPQVRRLQSLPLSAWKLKKVSKKE